MYSSPKGTLDFKVGSQGKTELSAGAPSIKKRTTGIHVFETVYFVCLHLTFKQDDIITLMTSRKSYRHI